MGKKKQYHYQPPYGITNVSKSTWKKIILQHDVRTECDKT